MTHNYFKFWRDVVIILENNSGVRLSLRPTRGTIHFCGKVEPLTLFTFYMTQPNLCSTANELVWTSDSGWANKNLSLQNLELRSQDSQLIGLEGERGEWHTTHRKQSHMVLQTENDLQVPWSLRKLGYSSCSWIPWDGTVAVFPTLGLMIFKIIMSW